VFFFFFFNLTKILFSRLEREVGDNLKDSQQNDNN